MGAVPVNKRLLEISLFNVAAAMPEALIEEGETSYHKRLNDAADAILTSGAKIVMLTGPSASGKTTTAHKLADVLQSKGSAAHVISLDNFFLGSEFYPLLADGSKDYESPATLDMPEINRCLSALYREGQADLPVYDFAKEKRSEQHIHLELNGGIVIVEGTHALNPDLTMLLPKESVFRIYAGLREEYSVQGRRSINTRDIRLCRRVLRDAQSRGHSPERTLAMWHHVLDAEYKYIRIYKNNADLILDTSHTYELGIIAGIAHKALEMTPETCPRYDMLAKTVKRFGAVRAIPVSLLPADSMLQEFYGNNGY